MYYKVTLLDNSLDQSEADVIPLQTANGWLLQVTSQNPKLKQHLEMLLMSEYYTLAPGRATEREATDCVLQVLPNTLEYFQLLPEYLSWRGYFATFVNQIHKSFNWIETDVLTLKAADTIHTNEKGERIVEKVPEGYIAVKNDGTVLVGGQRLHANIDKPNAEWRLDKNPYADMDENTRGQHRKEILSSRKQDFHPGLVNQIYSGQEYRIPDVLQSHYDPRNRGTSLSEFYGSQTPNNGAEAEQINTPAPAPKEKKTRIPAGTIIYSPQLGLAMDTKFWPPAAYGDESKYKWYTFAYPEDYQRFEGDPEKLKKILEVRAKSLGKSPAYIYGVKDGVVSTDKNLPVDNGFEYILKPKISIDSLDNVDTSTLVVNQIPDEQYLPTDIDSAEYVSQITKVSQLLSPIKSRTAVLDESTGNLKIDPALANEKIPDLTGKFARFEGSFEKRPYQVALIHALTTMEQYEFSPSGRKTGGPRGVHGHFLRVEQGLGKTATVLAAEAVLRNRGEIKEGSQTTLITAPSQNTYGWLSEVKNFRRDGGDTMVIDGIALGKSTPDKNARIQQWEKVLEKARQGKLPHFLIISASKFTLDKNKGKDDDDDNSNIDMKYMQMLASGGSSNGKPVDGGHIGLCVVDESAQYLNRDSGRSKAFRNFADHLYHSKALVWSLNGDIISNSATDLIMEMSLLNKYVRDNISHIENVYTMPDPARPYSSVSKWRPGQLYNFMRKFKNQIYSLSGETVAGENYGLQRNPDLITPLGAQWGDVYKDAVRTITTIYDPGANGRDPRLLGILNLLINSSYGAVTPQRLLEYNLGKQDILREMKGKLSDDDFRQFIDQLNNYQHLTTEVVRGCRVPKFGLKLQDRDAIYQREINQDFRSALDRITDTWDNPYVDALHDKLKSIVQQAPATRKTRQGVALNSKRAIMQLYKRLNRSFMGKGVRILLFTGDQTPKEIDENQRHHINPDHHSISLVTGAAKRGVNIPSVDGGYRGPSWSIGDANQFEKRFQRSAEQIAPITVAFPSGIVKYMREIENRKKMLMEETEDGAVDSSFDHEEADSENFKSMDGDTFRRLIDKLTSPEYQPEVLPRRS